MKISYNWLKEFVDFDQTPDQLAHLLSFLGFETCVVSGNTAAWQGVITARVLEVQRHPNADKLSLCRVTDGTDTYSIVCGAPNVAAGQIIPLARIGAVLPGDFKIKRAKIRGVESEGMICSETELGLAAESAGIMVLPEATELGKRLEDVFGERDAILEVEITTNRPDCLSHWGVAREIAAKLGKPVRIPAVPAVSDAGDVRITIKDPERCGRYIGASIEGVSVRPSPDWIRKRLEKCGLRPINNIVDITNYVLLELGHPLHAFDRATMKGGQIVVRKAETGEKIAALDGKQYALTDDMLVIADAEKPQAIAGVMGGEHSGVTEGTKDIILESALFQPAGIRRTSKALNLSTDASYRFERGTAWDVCALAAQRAADLILQSAGGKVTGRRDEKAAAHTPVTIELRTARVRRVLGIEVPAGECRAILQHLGIVVSGNDEVLKTVIPSWRLDLKQEIDLIEEIARIRGYETVPVTVMPMVPGVEEERAAADTAGLIAERLRSLGFAEAVNSSFDEEKNLRKFAFTVVNRIANPLSKENEVLRPSLLPGLWRNLALNVSQGYSDVKLFENGTIFTSDGEKRTIAFIAYGSVWPQWWRWEGKDVPETFDFYFLNGVVQRLLDGNKVSVTALSQDDTACFHPGKAARIVMNGIEVGRIGVLRPDLASELPNEVCYAEFDRGLLENRWRTGVRQYAQLRRFPPVKRDLSIVAPKDLPFGKLETVFKESMTGAEAILQETGLFSRFELPGGSLSYSFHLVFRHPDHTLTDAEVNSQIEKIIERLKREGASLR